MPERPNFDRRPDSRGDSRGGSRSGPPRSGGSGAGRPPGPRPSRPSGPRDDDRAPRRDDRGSAGDRAPRRDDRGASGDRAPRRDFGDRAPRRDDRGSDDRAPRRDFGDRAPRRDDRGSDDRAPRRYGTDSRSGGSGAGRPPGPRPSRPSGPRDDDRAPRRDFGDRAPRRDDRGSDDRAPRRDFGDRAPRRDDRGGSDDRAPRRDDRGATGDRAPRRDFGDRALRRDDRGGSDDRAPRRYGAGAGRPSGPRRDDSRDGGRRSGPRKEDFAPREPRNEAERRRAAVRARGGGAVRKDLEQTPVSREPESWIDEGPVEGTGVQPAAGNRKGVAPRRNVSARVKDEIELDPQVKADVAKILEPRRAVRLSERLKLAQVALERERYSEAKRIAKSLTKELSGVAAVHEVIGLASYRMGQWRDATAALELARSLRIRTEDMPVLADCYRAQRRWSDCDAVWAELKELSPSPEVMAEGRMVVAGSLADRGELKDAIDLMLRVVEIPRRVHEHHLKQWYVLGDLYDRAGNVQKAREFFQRVALHDTEFADVSERLKAL
jgi:tetratricopeptide (TPR) repeat protein